MTEAHASTPGSPVNHEMVPPLPQTPISQSSAEMWRTFFSLTGGSLFYCLSALSIIYGLAQILGPLLAQPHTLRDALPCLGAINGYEIALIAVLVLIVVWQNVTDDAISLVVLVALFLVGSGMSLSVVANSGPRLALYVGLACLALAMGKLFILRRFIGLSLSLPCIGALAAILAVNFGSGALLASVGASEVSRGHWLVSWLVVLAGGVTVLLDGARGDGCAGKETTTREPFLRRLPMIWIFVAIVLIASGVHQYLLGYVFEVTSAFGDYLPLIGVVSLLAIQLSVSLRGRADGFEVVLSLLPLAACAYALLAKSVAATSSMGIQLLWFPPVFLGLMGIAVLWSGVRVGSHHMLAASVGYFLGIILTIGFSPERPHDLNWYAFGSLLVSALFVVGLIRQSVALCFLGVVVSTIGVAGTNGLQAFARAWSLTDAGAIVGVGGLGTLMVAGIFGRRMPRALAVLGALGVMALTFDFLPRDPGQRDVAVAAGVVILGLVMWVRVRSWPPVVILSVPIVCRLWFVFTKLTSWRYVILSFVLLVAGGWISVRKGKRARRITERDTRPNVDK